MTRPVRPDRPFRVLTRAKKQGPRGKYAKYNESNLRYVASWLNRNVSIRQTSKITKIPSSTVGEMAQTLREVEGDVDAFVNRCLARNPKCVLSPDEEKALSAYIVWHHRKGCPLAFSTVKALIRDMNAKAIALGQSRQSINPINGPTGKYWRGFLKRNPTVAHRTSETVDRGRINMATKTNIMQYFTLLRNQLINLGIAEDDGKGGATILKPERIYLADETGWGVEKQGKKVVGEKGAKHCHTMKPSDESHKSLMLCICGNGDVLKPLLILEESFPLVGEGEADHIPQNMLLSKTANGSMEKPLYVDWLQKCVLEYKSKINPDHTSLLIIDNHSSRLSTAALELSIDNQLVQDCYPGHLTHILQGPDVVCNKPIKAKVDVVKQNNFLLTGSPDLSRIAFIATVDNAVREVCTPAIVLKAFEKTGVISFNPSVIDLSRYPSSMLSDESESPVKVTCSTCRKENVDLHPLVKQNIIPKRLANTLIYTPPPEKTKTKCRKVEYARCITSDEVRSEVREMEERKRKKTLPKVTSEEVKSGIEKKKKKKRKALPKVLLKGKRQSETKTKKLGAAMYRKNLNRKSKKNVDSDESDSSCNDTDFTAVQLPASSSNASTSKASTSRAGTSKRDTSKSDTLEVDTLDAGSSKILPAVCSLTTGDCVEIVDGLFLGYYAVITWAPPSETMNNDDEVEIQFLTLQHGKYVLSNHDYDSRPPKDLKKVKFELDSRLRYTIL